MTDTHVIARLCGQQCQISNVDEVNFINSSNKKNFITEDFLSYSYIISPFYVNTKLNHCLINLYELMFSLYLHF